MISTLLEIPSASVSPLASPANTKSNMPNIHKQRDGTRDEKERRDEKQSREEGEGRRKEEGGKSRTSTRDEISRFQTTAHVEQIANAVQLAGLAADGDGKAELLGQRGLDVGEGVGGGC